MMGGPKGMLSDPRFWRSMRLFFLAPDFLYSKVQHIAQGALPYYREQRMAIGLAAGTLYITSRILNKILGGDFYWEHPFQVKVGDKLYSMRSLPGDIAHLISSPRMFIYHRLSPAVSFTTETLTKKDALGRPIDWADWVKDALLSPVPIPVTTAAGKLLGRPTGLEMRDALAQTMGLSVSPYHEESDVRKWATSWKISTGDPKLEAQVERAQKETLLPSDYANMRDMLRNGDLEAARREYIKLVPGKGGGLKGIRLIDRSMRLWANAPFTGSRGNEERFYKSLSPEQKDLYNKARVERKQIFQEFERMRKGTTDAILKSRTGQKTKKTEPLPLQYSVGDAWPTSPDLTPAQQMQELAKAEAMGIQPPSELP
jgi:hypothetical protein